MKERESMAEDIPTWIHVMTVIDMATAQFLIILSGPVLSYDETSTEYTT